MSCVANPNKRALQRIQCQCCLGQGPMLEICTGRSSNRRHAQNMKHARVCMIKRYRTLPATDFCAFNVAFTVPLTKRGAHNTFAIRTQCSNSTGVTRTRPTQPQPGTLAPVLRSGMCRVSNSHMTCTGLPAGN